MNRRLFSKLGLLIPLAPVSVSNTSMFDKPKKLTNIFVHHVYFWLKNPQSREDLQKLTEGLSTLTRVRSIKSFHIGVPAASSRDVIDGSYSISWLTIFMTAKDEEKYQKDPVHFDFVKNYQHLWSKVVVYDSIDK